MNPDDRLIIPKNTVRILQKYDFHFSKKLGQNFLIDDHVMDRIIKGAGISRDDCALEIGPGIGTMTQFLGENAGKVIAVELDKKLIPILEDTLSEFDNITVINDDILKTDITALAKEYNGGRPMKVVANLPYYVTTPVLMKILEDIPPVGAPRISSVRPSAYGRKSATRSSCSTATTPRSRLPKVHTIPPFHSRAE